MKPNDDKTIQPASLDGLKNRVEIKRGNEGIKSVSFREKAVENDLSDPRVRDAYTQIMAYMNGEKTILDFPVELRGTEFQVSVYKAIMHIPYGESWTYKDVAEFIGRPNAQRAVGGALNKNPLSLIVPCHRVVGANGKLVGFGSGLPVKKALLNLEGII